MALDQSPDGPPTPQAEEPEDLPLSEVMARHKDQWVAMVVTARDRNLQPVRGKVVASDIDRYRLRRSLLKYDDVCIFYAGEPPYPLFL